MALMKILYYPHSVLTTKGRDVEVVDDRVRKILDDMAETMYANKGLGLASNQVGLLERLVVIDIPEDKERGIRATGLLQMINPRIVVQEGHIVYQEGCLSFPGLYIDVPRAAHVVVEFLDREGKPQRMEADGLLGVAFQHEVDHTNGIVFVDRLDRKARKRALREYDRLRKEMGL